jgi:hypothetical protein
MRIRVWISVLWVCCGAAIGIETQGCRNAGPFAEDLQYLQKISGLRLPDGVFDVAVERPREFCVTGRLSLPKDRIDSFVRNNGFVALHEYPLNHALGLDKARFKADPPKLGIVGRSAKQRWEIALDPIAGTLWFVVLFEDMSGDAPG